MECGREAADTRSVRQLLLVGTSCPGRKRLALFTLIQLAGLQIRQRRLVHFDAVVFDGLLQGFDLFVEFLDVIQHVIDRVGNRIRHVGCHAVGIETDFAGDGSPLLFFLLPVRIHHVSGNTHDRGSRRHAAQDD